MTELPKGWATCEIGEVLVPVEMTGKDEADREIWYVDISSIDNESNRIVDPKRLSLAEAPSRARQKIKAGDTLFSTVRPYLRKIAAVPEKYNGEIASTGFAVLRPAEGVHHRYIFYKAISHDFVSALTGEQYGVSYPAVKEEQVRSQALQLPPTHEQRRIVERIEAMFDEIDHGVENLKKARATLGLYRQSLLKSAFEGRLTADWRARNAGKLETPETLLARIQKERDTRYKSALDDWQKALNDWRENGEEGKKPSKPKRLSQLRDIDQDELDTLPVLPASWQYTGLANLGELGRGKSKHRPRNDKRLFGGPHPFIQTGEVKAAGRYIRSFDSTYSDFGLAQSKIWPAGTLCITIAANIAETAFLTFDACFPDSVVGFSSVAEHVRPDYIELFIKSARANIEAYAPATAQKNINLQTLETLVVPICSPEEQAEITRILDERIEAADALEAEIAAGLTRAEALRQSILKQAFSGKLVPQDPEDEPAADLLARIKAEKATKPKKRRATNA